MCIVIKCRTAKGYEIGGNWLSLLKKQMDRFRWKDNISGNIEWYYFIRRNEFKEVERKILPALRKIRNEWMDSPGGIFETRQSWLEKCFYTPWKGILLRSMMKFDLSSRSNRCHDVTYSIRRACFTREDISLFRWSIDNV